MTMQESLKAAPSMGNALKSYVIRQFKKPHGILGMLAGQIMRRRRSNVKRNLWTIELMTLQQTDRVFEIGFGPGLALEQVCARLNEGRAVGLDHSKTMFDMARRRNTQALRSGILKLLVGSVEDQALLDDTALTGPFDLIYAVNVAMFWRDPVEVLSTLRRRLAEDGRILLTFQPRSGARTDAAAMAAGENLAGHMRSAGFEDIRIESLKEVLPMAVCVMGKTIGRNKLREVMQRA